MALAVSCFLRLYVAAATILLYNFLASVYYNQPRPIIIIFFVKCLTVFFSVFNTITRGLYDPVRGLYDPAYNFLHSYLLSCRYYFIV